MSDNQDKAVQDSYKLSINGKFEYELNEMDTEGLDLLATGPDTYHLLVENTPYHAKIVSVDFNNRKYVVKVNSGTYEVDIHDQLDLLIDRMGFAQGSSKDISAIEAPMPGLILDINVRIGQAVNEDDPLVILEAMKMENVITSPRDGIIKNIAVEKGAAVDKKHVLIEFE